MFNFLKILRVPKTDVLHHYFNFEQLCSYSTLNFALKKKTNLSKRWLNEKIKTLFN